MNYIFLETTDSTLSYAAQHQSGLEHMTMIAAHEQIAGRGQRGNSWESDPGKNLTVTLFFRPGEEKIGNGSDADTLPMAERQFLISEATALAVTDTLRRHGVEASVKWPNDVYVGDSKICGILIEHTLLGDRIDNTRCGVGINVNQQEFLSDAPNPVSLAQLTGRETELAKILEEFSSDITARLEERLRDSSATHRAFLDSLWRKDGRMHPFRLRDADSTIFLAEISDVRRDGLLELRDETGRIRSFRFKEVEFILN